mmetsp:Transcript_34302/g.110156  ORF Transcript_34302/g.110156 Transcript_34302/m.110156 type:complete len:505 (-) Transcript_34302:186-1700(-)
MGPPTTEEATGSSRLCTAKSMVMGLGLVALGAWAGFVAHVPPPQEHASSAGAPPRPKRSTAQRDDDLETAKQVLHEVVPLDAMAIKPGDWSAGGRFVRPTPKALGDLVELGGESSSYPPTEPLVEILKRWNPDNVTVPTPFKETLQVFNYSDPSERELAAAYRDAELPFKLYDIPTIEAVRVKWTDAYLVDAIDAKRNVQYKVERSENNHFMYWQHKSGASSHYRDWRPPTTVVSGVSYAKWLDWARAADAEGAPADDVHHYLMMGTQPLTSIRRKSLFRGGGSGKKKDTPPAAKNNAGFRHFVNNDLDIFTPESENFFVTNVKANKGIQCRFGMRGVIAEAHYDGGRNMVAMLKGAKRYVLSPPASCKDLAIIPDRRHPSFRHSTTDWSHQAQAEAHLNDAHAIDTVLREGEILYIPSYWIHYIVSLKYSIQCNTRSGAPPNGEGSDHVRACVGDDNSGGPPDKARRRKRRAEEENAQKAAATTSTPEETTTSRRRRRRRTLL